jgi:hypothetical protein
MGVCSKATSRLIKCPTPTTCYITPSNGCPQITQLTTDRTLPSLDSPVLGRRAIIARLGGGMDLARFPSMCFHLADDSAPLRSAPRWARLFSQPAHRCDNDSPTRMQPAPDLDQHAKAGLGAELDAVPIGVVNIECLLAVVPGLDLGGYHTFVNHVLMGRVNIVHLKGRVVGRR